MLCWRVGRIGARAVHGWVDRGFRWVLDGNWCGWRWPLGVAILARCWVLRGCVVVVLVGGLGSAKAIQSGGSHPCVVNELADALAAWRAGTVGLQS